MRDSISAKGLADMLDHANSEMAIASKLGIDATKKPPGEGFKRPSPTMIRMEETVQRRIDTLLKTSLPTSENRVRS